ncbi:TraR/DksA family transcriptional regulator [Massilia sp. 9096]|uniref:TraR/DksA family transcriptional regulator n=1 Tax=Massilia sp. 9096 TaxID=1500894 RepID=UPI000B095F73|nr:TraR/DksA family transcriptional regulator [Massilia sp. 9096]
METLSPEQLGLLKSMLEQRLDALAHAGPPVASTPAGELPVSEVETSPLDRATVRLLNDLTREAAAQRAKEAQVLRQALARIEDGCYGECEECGQPIGASRLLARPEARLCIACQMRAERR